MKLIRCPHCGTTKSVTKRGECPSCRRQLEAASDSVASPPWSEEAATKKPPPVEAAVEPPSNPYAPPVEIREIEYQHRDDERAAPRSLMWVLFSFNGRIPRRVYWFASLGVTFLFYLAVFLLAAGFEGEDSPLMNIGVLVLYGFLIWTTLAISAKRWHDRDKSGAWILVNFIPLIGPLWVFIENGCLRGTRGRNRYGPDPT